MHKFHYHNLYDSFFQKILKPTRFIRPAASQHYFP